MPKLILPWRYIAMLAVGLAVLFVLMARYGRNPTVLIGWLIVWLFVSRGVDYLARRRQRRQPVEED
jgi:hypothetical protein